MAPRFTFAHRCGLKIDLKVHGISYIIHQIYNRPDTYFYFSAADTNTYAYGGGATRYVYNHLCKELTRGECPLMINVDTYFMDINRDNIFWQSEDNIRCFVMFIAMVASSGTRLPYHFTPKLLECIANREMNSDELKYYIKLIDPELFANADKVSPDDFNLLNSGYEIHDTLYRSKVIGDNNCNELIYHLIAEQFGFFINSAIADCDILTIDHSFSGTYKITADDVIEMMAIDNKYLDGWSHFIRKLDESELKQMLILFGNTLAMGRKYYIYVTSRTKLDISITTCSYEITINSRFFESDEAMQKLKIYFDSDDDISDEYTVHEKIQERSETDPIESYSDDEGELDDTAISNETIEPTETDLIDEELEDMFDGIDNDINSLEDEIEKINQQIFTLSEDDISKINQNIRLIELSVEDSADKFIPVITNNIFANDKFSRPIKPVLASTSFFMN